jgi:hypothetical protein
MNIKPRSFVPILLLSLLAIACGTAPGGTGSPNPGASPTPTPPPTTGATPTPTPTSTPSSPTPSPSFGPTSVASVAQAAALVFASDPRWAQMVPLRPDLIGASMWYEAFEAVDGFTVTITAGSGDCEAGCIDQHRWNYHVDYDATVTLAGEDGDDVEVEPVGGGNGPARVTVQLIAGPVCPVEQVPPDPNCEGRSVANAEVVIRDSSGVEVGRATSDDQGMLTFELDAGAYYAEAQPVDGLMGTPEAQAFSVIGGGAASLLMGYDTGIR